MPQVAIIDHPDCEGHDPGPNHPECPQRLRVARSYLESMECHADLIWLLPEPATMQLLELVHPASHCRFVEASCLGERGVLDAGDTRVCEDSYRAALLAAGGAKTAVDAVCSGSFTKALAMVRPPGHHAGPSSAMGFCLFNNIAIAARYARHRYGLERVCIVDWDAHHGNGTQEIFWSDGGVLFFSLHQHPFYPGTGAASENGAGPASRLIINVPLPRGSRVEAYVEAFDRLLTPAVAEFQPELFLISAGFDAHHEDPLAQLGLREADFGILTDYVGRLASRYAKGRIVSVLEGGYNLTALAHSIGAHVEALWRQA